MQICTHFNIQLYSMKCSLSLNYFIFYMMYEKVTSYLNVIFPTNGFSYFLVIKKHAICIEIGILENKIK